MVPPLYLLRSQHKGGELVHFCCRGFLLLLLLMIWGLLTATPFEMEHLAVPRAPFFPRGVFVFWIVVGEDNGHALSTFSTAPA